MRHRRAHRKLGRTASHRVAMLRNLVTDFFDREKVVTTVPKAKELRPVAEKLITLGKRETLHARRRALRLIRRKSVVQKLFDTLAPRYADRHGGYTRIIRLGQFRKGDNAELAIIELVESEPVAAKAEEGKKEEKKASTAKGKGRKKKTEEKGGEEPQEKRE